MNLRIKFIVACLASIALIGFLLAMLTTRAVQKKRQQIEDRAIELARVQGEGLKSEIEGILEKQIQPTREHLEKRLNELMRNATLDTHTDMEITIRDPQTGDKVSVQRRRVYTTTVLNLQPNTDMIGIQIFPIESDLEWSGEVKVGVHEQAILEEIGSYGEEITGLMSKLTFALFLLMIFTFYILWRIIRHWLALEHGREERQRMAYVGTLAAGLAHEIRNPLNAMNLNLDLIREETQDPQKDSPERVNEVIELLQEESRQLNHTLTDFLAFANPEKRELGSCDLCIVIKETKGLMDPQYLKADAKIILDLPEMLQIEGNADGLKQVFINLLLNALHAMTDQSESKEKQVSISLHTEKNEAIVHIKDTGSGIAPADWEKIFEVFHSTKKGGSGFGLAIVRRILTDHNGTIQIKESNSNGTTFEINIPI